MTGTLKTMYYSLHPRYTGYGYDWNVVEEEFPQGVKKAKYRRRIFRNIETGDDVPVRVRKHRVWIEWNDGSETTKYQYYCEFR